MKWLLVAIVAVLVSILFDLGLLVYGAYVLVAIIVGTRWITRYWARSIQSTRHCSHDEAEVGTVVTITNTLTNTGRLPIPWVLVEDVLPPGSQLFRPPRLEIGGERIQVFRLRPGESRTVTYRLTCHRRGYYQIGPLLVETGDMFGLFRRFKVATEPNYLMVLPRPVPLEGYNLASRRPVGEIRLTHRLFEDPTRIAGVRGYQSGDPLNRVHWQATARTGQLHSKIYEPSSMAGATVLLDFHEASHQRRHEPYRSEIAITAAASLAHTLYHLGQQVGLITNGRDAADRIRLEGWDRQGKSRQRVKQDVEMLANSDRLRPLIVPTRQGVDQFRQIMTTLARLELTDGLPLPELILEAESRLPRDATVVAIVPRVTEATTIALTSLVNQGYAVTAIINTYEYDDYARQSGPLIATGIHTLHLRDEESLTELCRQQMVTH